MFGILPPHVEDNRCAHGGQGTNLVPGELLEVLVGQCQMDAELAVLVQHSPKTVGDETRCLVHVDIRGSAFVGRRVTATQGRRMDGGEKEASQDIAHFRTEIRGQVGEKDHAIVDDTPERELAVGLGEHQGRCAADEQLAELVFHRPEFVGSVLLVVVEPELPRHFVLNDLQNGLLHLVTFPGARSQEVRQIEERRIPDMT